MTHTGDAGRDKVRPYIEAVKQAQAEQGALIDSLEHGVPWDERAWKMACFKEQENLHAARSCFRTEQAFLKAMREY